MQRKNSPKKQGTRGSRRAVSRPAKQIVNSSSPMVYAPTAMSRAVVSQRIPRIMSNGNVTRISHSEFFANIASTGTLNYHVDSFSCNPGVASIFPWLSQVALRYETYKFRRLSFEYHTRSPTSQVGTAGLVFDFDAADPAPVSQMEGLQYHDKSADSPWKDQCLVLDLGQGDRLPVRYTRAGTPSGNYDIKTYDVGRLHVFTDGVGATQNLGLLEVKYVIDLYTPQIQNPLGGMFISTAGLDATHLFGTAWAPDSLAIAMFGSPSTSVLTFNQIWEGVIYFNVNGTGLLADFAPVVEFFGTAGTAAVVTQYVNGAGTTVSGCFRMRSIPGTTMTPTITATTVVSVLYVFASAAYDACGS